MEVVIVKDVEELPEGTMFSQEGIFFVGNKNNQDKQFNGGGAFNTLKLAVDQNSADVIALEESSVEFLEEFTSVADHIHTPNKVDLLGSILSGGICGFRSNPDVEGIWPAATPDYFKFPAGVGPHLGNVILNDFFIGIQVVSVAGVSGNVGVATPCYDGGLITIQSTGDFSFNENGAFGSGLPKTTEINYTIGDGVRISTSTLYITIY